MTLEQKPIEQTSEFIATVRSLRSTTVQPEVDGLVTRIFVKSGDRVRAGAPLVQINAAKQQATVTSTEANRAGTEADVQYWRQQVKRLESLVGAGAISRQEFDQAQNSLRTAEARLAALDAQVREGRVELQYYRVDAPQAGVIGDIPIRTGDRVTTSTVITTIDDSGALEAYIQIPLDRSPDLRLGLPVQLLDGDGKVAATNPITFVAPRVDDAHADGARQERAAPGAAGDAGPAVRARPRRVAEQARRDGADDRGLAGQRPVLLLRGRARPATAWSRGSVRCRSASWSATTTWSPAASRPATRSSSRASRRSATAPPIKAE